MQRKDNCFARVDVFTKAKIAVTLNAKYNLLFK
jgi:hypothetical protein